ncbi:MAG: HAD family hydrolase [Treponema sp.]|jgi:putative hydrolase of the HAD superfamily|nr:HAD family hydrolase [Treponema sp.]
MAGKRLILFIDSGDTLVDEAAQVWDNGIVVETALIPGAAEALRLIRSRAYTIALVADGEKKSFDNVYRQHGLEDCFDVRAVSGVIGVQKPDPLMFRTALEQLGLSGNDKGRIVMVGNNLRRDIRGANLFGIASVLIDWSPRYPRESAEPCEIPDYTIHTPAELPPLLETLEEALARGEPLKKESRRSFPAV